jgi:hypothetical protein
MRTLPTLIAIALCAASVGAASGQRTVAPVSGKAVNGIGLAFDAPRGQFTASGIQLKPSVKSNVSSATTGTIDVTINIKLISRLSRESTLPCSVIVIGGIIDTDNGTVDGGIETVNGEARVSGAGMATCTVSIPYAWDLASDSGAQSGLILAYAVASVDHRGITQRSTLQLSGIENLPANGATSKFSFDAAL